MGGAEEINSQKNTDKAQHRIEYIESTKRCITKYVHKFFFPLLLCYSALGGTNDDGSMELNGGHHGCPRVTINSVPLSLFSSPSCLLTTTPVFLCLMSIRSVYIHRGRMYCPFFPIVNGKADLLYGLIQRSGHLYGGQMFTVDGSGPIRTLFFPIFSWGKINRPLDLGFDTNTLLFFGLCRRESGPFSKPTPIS